jgi:hypothetical protein
MRGDLNALEERFRHPAIKSDLERIDLFRLPVFLARELISQQNTPFIPAPNDLQHSDFYPVLEYVAQRAFFVRAGTDMYLSYDESKLTRPATFLGEYLKRRPLTENDFKAFALFYNTQRLPEGNLYRSILTRWQHDFPESSLPLEFAAKLEGGGNVAAELEIVRMAPYRDRIFKIADREPELLQLYARFLLQAYRAHRSVYFTPSASEAEAALQRLVEVDPANRRVHLLRLAEIAWDRGDDAGCLKLGQSAFDPDTNTAGPINFDLDKTAAPRVLRLMIESLWRTGKLPEAWQLCQEAERNRFVGETAKTKDPVLEMTYRKVEDAVRQLGVPPRS